MPSLVYAEDGKFTYLEPQMPAPFKGTLFDDSATAHLLTLPDYYQSQCDVEVDYQLGLSEEKFNFERSDLKAQIKFLETENTNIMSQYDQRIDLLEKELKKKNKNDRPWILAAGIAIGTGVTIGIVKALESSP